MEYLTDAGHQHQHTHQTVHHGGDACQQTDGGGHHRLHFRRGSLCQKHGGHEADGHAQQDRARRTVDAGEDEGQDAEFRLGRRGVPLRAKQKVDKADLPDGRDAGDNKIYGDEQNTAHRYQSQ